LAADEVDQSEHAQRQFESMLDVVFSDNIHWGRISTVSCSGVTAAGATAIGDGCGGGDCGGGGCDGVAATGVTAAGVTGAEVTVAGVTATEVTAAGMLWIIFHIHVLIAPTGPEAIVVDYTLGQIASLLEQ